MIPNKEVFEKPLVNYSMSAKRRIDIEVGVTYETDLEKAVEVATGAIEELDFLLEGEPVEVLARGFGGSSIDFSVRYWIDVEGEVAYPRARHAGVLAIKRAFDANGIEIPFPIRTLDLSRARGVPISVDDGRPEPEAASVP